MPTATIPAAIAAAGIASAGIGAAGSIASGEAQSKADKYNAALAGYNQITSQRNATYAGRAGDEQAGMEGLKSRANAGAVKTNQAAGGIDVNKGSAVDVQSSAAEMGKLDALTIRSNAARQAYGFQTQAVSEGPEVQIDQFSAKNAETAGEIGAATTFLGGASSAGSNFLRYQQAGGLTA